MINDQSALFHRDMFAGVSGKRISKQGMQMMMVDDLATLPSLNEVSVQVPLLSRTLTVASSEGVWMALD